MKEKKYIIIICAVVTLAVIAVVSWKFIAPRMTATTDAAVPNSLPAQIDPESIGKIVRDTATGKDFISNQIIVEFSTEISEETALEIIAGLGGKMQARFTAAPLFLVVVKDPGDGSASRAAVKKLISDKRVVRADMNFLTTKPVENGTVQ